MSEEHHSYLHVAESILHRYFNHLAHVALEGDFSNDDINPLPYAENATNEEKLNNTIDAMSETSKKLRYFEWHPDEIDVDNLEKLENRYAALDHHMSHLIAENHLEQIYANKLVRAR